MLLNSLPMQPNFKELFPDLAPDSRIWIYTSDRVLTEEESNSIREQLELFVQKWSTHGSSMKAYSDVLLERFIVIAADEKYLAASGCSIDSSVRFIKEIGVEFKINFFDRMKVYALTSNGILQVPYHSLKELSGQYFDPLIQTLGDLRSNWPVSV